ncbi:ABC transporter permease subunit [Rossellomorea sp. YZS02]|uniref:ABC transporter permease subunit n=1 Tax=Rossellomorea sp. YZS02 TaxID=3097358 RepID=UPI002A114F63|nr:ABC transporter permease subunit [Rossellomorea sp. YZS02]MDX8342506.1 ABC transporter permease subunit [Rossellomorea sp. YZS02]
MITLWRNKLFMTGFLFIFLMLMGSLMYGWFFDNDIPIANLRFTEDGVKGPPYSPWEYPPFGTNNLAESMFHILLIGAKFTLGVAFLVAALRFVISSVWGTLSELYLPRVNERVRPFLEAFYYYPVTLIAYLMLYWVLFEDGMFNGTDSEFTYGFGTRVIIEILVLTLAAVPITSLTISKEVNLILKKEFMDSVQILGGNRRHILMKHILPFLKPQLVVIFLREMIQVLILLAHLGILGIFFGGGTMKEDLFQNMVFVSLSNEWSGIIGNNFQFLFTTYWWIAICPIFLLTLTVLAFKLMLEGYQSVVASSSESLQKPEKVDITPVGKEERFERVRRSI